MSRVKSWVWCASVVGSRCCLQPFAPQSWAATKKNLKDVKRNKASLCRTKTSTRTNRCQMQPTQELRAWGAKIYTSLTSSQPSLNHHWRIERLTLLTVCHVDRERQSASTSVIVPVWVSSATNPYKENLFSALLDPQGDPAFIDQQLGWTVGSSQTNSLGANTRYSLCHLVAGEAVTPMDAVRALESDFKGSR